MANDSDFARDVASGVLARMSVDGGPQWTVLRIDPYEEEIGPPTDPAGIHHLLITLGDASGRPDSDNVGVYFTAGLPREDAVVATATQIQDHAIEVMRGAALPACPGHPHPLQAGVRAGRALWVCPKDPAHHSEPVLRS